MGDPRDQAFQIPDDLCPVRDTLPGLSAHLQYKVVPVRFEFARVSLQDVEHQAADSPHGLRVAVLESRDSVGSP
jgi:hypothetical protein